ncbi:hypothetical protein DSCW_45530 [Desulfosarcina widdelii]|uniref:Tyr recombinase domain-containing protein n=1 Tax=Desulfosarcina widdelii TaxID=947919 RepID=A0A5K7Z5S1_9BACT|nr:hypothetical protein [Desulfosarcina widdelii]BBO77136.1 hypothetical protein DSCW_45530 [Desulfosarcina widdelii]
MGKLTDTQIQEIAVDHLQKWKDSFEAARTPLGDDVDPFLAHMALKKQIETFEGDRVSIRADLETGNYRDIVRELPEILEGYGLNIDEVDQDDPSFTKLCSSVLRAKERAISLYMDRLEGKGPRDDLDAAMDAVAGPLTSPTAAVAEPVDEGPLLSEVIEKYLAWQEKLPKDDKAKVNDPSAKANHIAALKLFVEFYGDIPIRRIEVQHVFEFQDMLCEYPTGRFRLGSPYREMTLKEIQGMDIEDTLMIPTINLYMNRVKLLFKYAIKRGHYKQVNPFADYRLSDSRSDAEKRSRFSKAELETLLKSKEYKDNLFDKPFQFWTPLIALFHGMRQKEIAQLYIADIEMKEGIPVFSVVQDEEDKRVKNATSRRHVPIHPFILHDLKFMKYVEQLKSEGEDRLFPELPFVKGSYGTKVSGGSRNTRDHTALILQRKHP